MEEREENEVSLLDLLVVVAENIKLLIFGPLAVGLLALGIAFAVPQSYVSQAILVLPIPAVASNQNQNQNQSSAFMPSPAQAAAMMTSPLVLDPLIESQKQLEGRSIEAARKKLGDQIKATVGKDGLLRLDVTATTPAQAQALANAVIDGWLKSTVPGDQDRADLEKRLGYAKVSLEVTRRLLDRLAAEGGVSLNKPLTRGEAGTSMVAIGELQARYLSEVMEIPRWLQGLSRDVVKQQPTLPTEPAAPKKSLIAVLSALTTGFVLLLWVFMRQAWRTAAKDPQVAEKQARLRAALGLK